MTDKISYTVNEALAASGIGRTKLYDLIRIGELKPAKIGTRTLILRTDLEGMLQRATGA